MAYKTIAVAILVQAILAQGSRLCSLNQPVATMAGMTPERPVQKRRVISPLHEMDGDDTHDDELVGTPKSNSDGSGPSLLYGKKYKLQLSHWKAS